MTSQAPEVMPLSQETASTEERRPDFAAQWEEARLVYPLYAALATQFGLAAPPYAAGELPPARPTRSAFDRDLKWLDAIDDSVLAYQIRQVPPHVLSGNEPSLRALVLRQLKRQEKNPADRDKIDLLLVQYFALCASEDLVRGDITLQDVARVIQPVLAEADPTPLEWCEPLEKILEKVAGCQSLRDLMEDGLLEQGRLLKDAAGCMFYDPAALVAFCRFNFVLRRAFIRMLHADLSAMRSAVQSLESTGVKTVDCRRAGFSAAETTARLRQFCESWRQPFQQDYTQSSVNRAFEQLLALRTDLEEALNSHQQAPGPERAGAPTASPSPSQQSQGQSSQGASPFASAEAAKVEPARVVPLGQADSEKCLEAIWEQLIALPLSRGRSMATITLKDTKFLLSAWEVTAFVSASGPNAEDLRRAVVARALLALAIDTRKRSGEQNALSSALLHARGEVSYLQGRIEQAKRAKQTETAVNLGISVKRLLSFTEEAEALRS